MRFCHTLLFSRSPQPSPPYNLGGGGTLRTNSSLFKVLEAKAEVMPAFLDWTRDWGRENTKRVLGLIDIH